VDGYSGLIEGPQYADMAHGACGSTAQNQCHPWWRLCLGESGAEETTEHHQGKRRSE